MRVGVCSDLIRDRQDVVVALIASDVPVGVNLLGCQRVGARLDLDERRPRCLAVADHDQPVWTPLGLADRVRDLGERLDRRSMTVSSAAMLGTSSTRAPATVHCRPMLAALRSTSSPGNQDLLVSLDQFSDEWLMTRRHGDGWASRNRYGRRAPRQLLAARAPGVALNRRHQACRHRRGLSRTFTTESLGAQQRWSTEVPNTPSTPAVRETRRSGCCAVAQS